MKIKFGYALTTLCVGSAAFLLTAGDLLGAKNEATKSPEGKIVYDFYHGSLLVYGVFRPENDTAKKNGLQAELEARKEGVRIATEHLAKVCPKADSGERIAGDWRSSLKSLGSVIYPKGVLEIELSAPLKDVFKPLKNTRVTLPKTPEGEDIAFKIPTVPATTTRCGTIKLTAEGKSVQIFPLGVTRSDTPFKVVSLSLTSDGSLQPATAEDAALLQKSQFMQDLTSKGKGTVDAPVVVAAVSSKN